MECKEQSERPRIAQALRNELIQYFSHGRLRRTAQALRNETQPSLELPPGYDLQGPGLLYDFLKKFSVAMPEGPPIAETTGQNQVIVQPGNASRSFQTLNVGPVMNTAPQINPGKSTSSSQMVGTSGQMMYAKCGFRAHSRFESGDTLLSCDVSSDGSILASGGTWKKPFICYTKIGHAFTTLDSHASTISEVRFQPGTNIFATASYDTTVKLWDANTRDGLLFTFIGHKGKVRSLDFPPLGKILFSCDHNVIKVLDVERRKVTYSFNKGGSIVRFQPESGSLLAIACRNVITILDSHHFTILHRLEENNRDIESMCWDVTGKLIACVTKDELLVWLVSERLCICRYPSNGMRFQSVIFHPRYSRVVVIGSFRYLLSLNLDNMIAYVKWSTTRSITGLTAFKGEENFFASVSDDSLVKTWV